MQLRDAAEILGVQLPDRLRVGAAGSAPGQEDRPGLRGARDRCHRAWRRAAPRVPPPRLHIRVRELGDAQADRLARGGHGRGRDPLARHVFDRLARGVPLSELCERVIAPALRRGR